MLFESAVTNTVYYGIAFILYITGIWTPSLIGVALLFGIGNAFDTVVSLAAYIYLLKKNKINLLNVDLEQNEEEIEQQLDCTLAGINGSLNRFLLNKNMHCFLVKGPWGVGKTFEVTEWAKTLKDLKNYKIIPLSLFGVGDVNELNSIAMSKCSLFNNFKKYIKSLNQSIAVGVTPISVNFPLIGVVANLLKEAYPKNTNKKYIFIIDDIERKDNKLSVEEIFGFIDQLPRENTKVIIISNLSDPVFSAFKEKIVETEFIISLPSDYAIESVCDNKVYEAIKEYKDFNINLRTIIKLNNILNSIEFSGSPIIIKILYFCLLMHDTDMFDIEEYREILYKKEGVYELYSPDDKNAYNIRFAIDEEIKRLLKDKPKLLYKFLYHKKIRLGLSDTVFKTAINNNIYYNFLYIYKFIHFIYYNLYLYLIKLHNLFL